MYRITVYEDAHADEPDEVLREGNLLVAMERAIEQVRDLPQEGREYDFSSAPLTGDELFEIFPETGHGTVIVAEEEPDHHTSHPNTNEFHQPV